MFKKSTSNNIWFALIALCYFTSLPVFAATIHVDGDASGANNGSNWADAYNYLQDALDAAVNGDEIWVAEGTYRPDESWANPDGTGSRDATFKLGGLFNPDKKNLVLKGGYAGFGEAVPDARDVQSYVTVLSGDLEMNDANVGDPCDLIDEPTRADNSIHILDGAYSGEPVLDGFTITGGRNDIGGHGGGIKISQDGSLTVKNCTFTENSADTYGGAIYYGGSNVFIDAAPYLTIVNCRFYGNFAGWRGGGIDSSGGVCVLSGCEFQANKCGLGGGAASLLFNDSVIVADCVFHENATLNSLNANNGGALHCAGRNLEVTDSVFTHNYAANSGGAVSWGGGVDGNSIFENCIFRENRGGGGGAASLGPGATTLNNCSFIDNDGSGGGGGALDYSNGSLAITECDFTGNITDRPGGAIDHREGDLSVTDCGFRNNSSGADGGAIWHKWGWLAMEDCSFIGNRAGRLVGGGGGAVYCSRSDITANSCSFSGNITGTGGAIRARDCGEVILTNCILSGNSAENDGGGMSLEHSGSITLTNCTLANNSSASYGGGMYNWSGSSPTVTNCILWGNTASSGGNEISNYSSTPVISYCDIAASLPGGAWDSLLGSNAGGNIDANPNFVDADGPDGIVGTEDDNLRLSVGSPCTDAGDGDVASETDILNNTRHDDPGTGNTGTGNPDYVDIGAYEFQGTICVVNAPDVYNMTESEAETELGSYGLTSIVTYEYSDIVAAGSVMRQTPAAGTSVACGSSVDLVISDGPRVPVAINIQKCMVKSGKRANTDKITISGILGATAGDLNSADQIHIVIESEADDYEVCNEFLAIDKSKIKKGKYTHKNKTGFSLKLDTIKGKFTLQGKNVNLTGLSCPLALEIEVGNYFGVGTADEPIVNGPKKLIPIEFMMGYADKLRVDKIKAKEGKKSSTDSLSVKGAFTLKDEPSDITSMTLSLGGQSLNIPGSAFSYKKTTVSCKNYDTGSGLVTAKFDTAKCKFIVTIKKAKLEETSGETTFGVLIDMSLSDSDYNESVPVNWP